MTCLRDARAAAAPRGAVVDHVRHARLLHRPPQPQRPLHFQRVGGGCLWGRAELFVRQSGEEFCGANFAWSGAEL